MPAGKFTAGEIAAQRARVDASLARQAEDHAIIRAALGLYAETAAEYARLERARTMNNSTVELRAARIALWATHCGLDPARFKGCTSWKQARKLWRALRDEAAMQLGELSSMYEHMGDTAEREHLLRYWSPEGKGPNHG